MSIVEIDRFEIKDKNRFCIVFNDILHNTTLFVYHYLHKDALDMNLWIRNIQWYASVYLTKKPMYDIVNSIGSGIHSIRFDNKKYRYDVIEWIPVLTKNQ